MISATLVHILQNELKAEANDGHYALPSGTRLTIFISTPGALFPIGKVTALSLKAEYVVLHSEEGRVFTDLADIAAVRVDQEADKKNDKALGFTR